MMENDQELQNLNERAEKPPRQTRSRKLIADFTNDYAEGWFFAVGFFYKNELDIKFTQVVEPVLDQYGEKIYEQKKDEKGFLLFRKDGSPQRQLKTKTIQTWTQGKFYNFKEGHVLYDSPKAYLRWDEAVKNFKFRCEILRATPVEIKNNNVVDGAVTFTLSAPIKQDNQIILEKLGQFHLTQSEFVEFLKTGLLNGEKIDAMTEKDSP